MKSPVATPVTDSLKVSVYAILVAFVGELTAVVNELTVGAVRSIVMAPELAWAVGAVLPAASETVLAVMLRVSVPFEQPVTATVTLVPLVADGVPTVQPVAVPEVVKSAALIPVTDSPKATVKVGLAAFVGEDGAVIVTLGATRSRVRLVPFAALPGPVLPAASVAPAAANCGVSVPVVEQLVTVTV